MAVVLIILHSKILIVIIITILLLGGFIIGPSFLVRFVDERVVPGYCPW
jgi:hypothetical protein